MPSNLINIKNTFPYLPERGVATEGGREALPEKLDGPAQTPGGCLVFSMAPRASQVPLRTLKSQRVLCRGGGFHPPPPELWLLYKVKQRPEIVIWMFQRETQKSGFNSISKKDLQRDDLESWALWLLQRLPKAFYGHCPSPGPPVLVITSHLISPLTSPSPTSVLGGLPGISLVSLLFTQSTHHLHPAS